MKLETIILEFTEEKKYFSVNALKVHLTKRKLRYPDTTINQYLYNLRRQKKLFHAGRGWYSKLPGAFVPDTKPVRELVSAVGSGFPLLNFSCWNTGQLQAFAHHLQASFIHFLYVENDAVVAVTEYLAEREYNAYANPGIREFEKYYKKSGRSVIVRPSISEEPVNGHYATIEKILVDLYIEKDRSNLMDGAEYKRIFDNIVYSYRINIARLLRYAHRRKVKDVFIRSFLNDKKYGIAL